MSCLCRSSFADNVLVALMKISIVSTIYTMAWLIILLIRLPPPSSTRLHHSSWFDGMGTASKVRVSVMWGMVLPVWSGCLWCGVCRLIWLKITTCAMASTTYKTCGVPAGGWGGWLHQIISSRVEHMKIKLDPIQRVCENERSKI